MRPLLGVALLLLLSLLGLQQLYVNAGLTFGATGLYDYLGLFVWGLSADLAQRSLHTLPGLGGR
jgi:TM2 domain-containing membrane protein YozV